MSVRRRVALVDDSPEIRLLALDVFTSEGMDIYVSERETLDLDDLARWSPDVVLIDPQGGAAASYPPFAVAERIRGDPRLGTVPFVLLGSPSTLRQDEPQLELVRPVRTIGKPFSLDELIDSVHRACDASESPRAAAVPQPGPLPPCNALAIRTAAARWPYRTLAGTGTTRSPTTRPGPAAPVRRADQPP